MLVLIVFWQKKALGLPVLCQSQLLWERRPSSIKLWCLLGFSQVKLPVHLLSKDRTERTALVHQDFPAPLNRYSEQSSVRCH